MPFLAGRKRAHGAIEESLQATERQLQPVSIEKFSSQTPSDSRKRPRRGDVSQLWRGGDYPTSSSAQISTSAEEPAMRDHDSTSTVQTTSPSQSEPSALQSSDGSSPSSATSTDNGSGTDSDSESDSTDELSDSSAGEENHSNAEAVSTATQRTPSPIPLIPHRQKPDIQHSAFAHRTPSLAARLKSFLPSLAVANAALEEDRAAGRLAQRDIENLDPLAADDEEAGGNGWGERQYIEMDLGLGVLEEKEPGDGSSGSESESGGSGERGPGVLGSSDERGGRLEGTERDVMGSLLGQRRAVSKVQIQELG